MSLSIFPVIIGLGISSVVIYAFVHLILIYQKHQKSMNFINNYSEKLQLEMPKAAELTLIQPDPLSLDEWNHLSKSLNRANKRGCKNLLSGIAMSRLRFLKYDYGYELTQHKLGATQISW